MLHANFNYRCIKKIKAEETSCHANTLDETRRFFKLKAEEEETTQCAKADEADDIRALGRKETEREQTVRIRLETEVVVEEIIKLTQNELLYNV